MNEINFNNVEELYQRVIPALNSKIYELKRYGIKSISSKDLFDFLAHIKWSKKDNLTLFDMVDDILNTSNEEIDNYFVNKFIEGKK